MPEKQSPRYTFVLDCYLYVEADTKEEADALAAQAVESADAHEGVYLELFDAWGMLDGKTGKELREVH